jgi:hypothetical protein
MKRSVAAKTSPACLSNCRAASATAASTPEKARSGVVSALPMKSFPARSETTTSVKVPPVSTEMRKAMPAAPFAGEI